LQLVEGPEDEVEAGGGLAAFELVDPPPGHAEPVGKILLIEPTGLPRRTDEITNICGAADEHGNAPV
jgi:hypothetical protein